MDTKRNDLTARNFPTAEEEAEAAQPPSRYGGPESAYRLAFTDTEFLLREELRPVRMQLELLKPEMVQSAQGIESTIVIFGSARILPPDVAARAARRRPQAGGDAQAHRAAPRCRCTMSRYYDEARALRRARDARARARSTRRSTSSPAAAPASWKPATAAPTKSAARASA